MKVHLVDGTYELFRSFYGAPPASDVDGKEVGATRGLLRTLLLLLRDPEVTHVAAAFDHVVESFRNDLYEGYKTGEGMDPDLHGQFPLAERAAHALGIVVWPLVEFEADDGMATGALRYSKDPRIDQVVLCSPDKDLAQCVRGDAIVCYDRRNDVLRDEAGVVEKFGVGPESIPDYLALVGDAADGFPGIEGWGAKSTAAVLGRFKHLEDIPDDAQDWGVKVRGAARLAKNLRESRDEAALFKRLATLRTDVPLEESLDDLEWRGARRDELSSLCAELGDSDVLDRVERWRDESPLRTRPVPAKPRG